MSRTGIAVGGSMTFQIDNFIKPIKGYEGLYSVTSNGKVWSIRQHHYMKPATNNNGYEKVVLHSADGKQKTFYIHRLVLNTFNPTNKMNVEVNHIDGNKKNNKLSNLEW